MLRQLAIIVTTRCDLRCAHCLRGHPPERHDFPLELLPRLLEEARPFGLQRVALTGGEPRLHPQFERIVESIVQAGFSWHFVSNGQQIEPYLPLMERFREQLGHVALSIDGATAEIHDEIRQQPGAFANVTAAARRCVALGYKVHISASLNQKNKGQMKELVELARSLGACGIRFGGTIPTPWNQVLVLSDAEAAILWQEIEALRKESDLEISTFSSLYTQGGVNFCGNLNLHELTVNAEGQVIFCCDTTGDGAVVGSLADGSLASLLLKWLEFSQKLQARRAGRISHGRMGEGFDTCSYCNAFVAPGD